MGSDPPGGGPVSLDNIGRIVKGRLGFRPEVAVGGIVIGIIGREKPVVAVDGIDAQPIPGWTRFSVLFWTILGLALGRYGIAAQAQYEDYKDDRDS
jgi:hypothetical protein